MLTSMMAFHWSSVSSSVSPPQAMPALLNIRSSRPVRATTASTAAATAVALGPGRVADAGSLQALGGAGRGGAGDTGADDVGARGPQRPAQRRADARAAAGDDR